MIDPTIGPIKNHREEQVKGSQKGIGVAGKAELSQLFISVKVKQQKLGQLKEKIVEIKRNSITQQGKRKDLENIE